MPTSTDVFAKVQGHEREEILRAAREADVLPYFHVLDSPAMPVVEMEGAERVMLGSNNYLGLTGDERVMQGAEDALHRYGTGLTGSRLLNGTIPLHLDLEREIAEWMGTEAAIVFTTGHQANVGTLGTLLGPGDTVIVDSGDHASILDGCLLSRAKLRPFRHNRLDKLEKMLERAQGDGGGVLVVVDGVFSMEGDLAPLQRICELCERYGARLMVDEAHGAGVLGARGAGACELLGVARPGRPADGHLLEVARLLRRLRRRTRRGDRVPADLLARVPLHRLRGARPRSVPRSRPCACCARPTARRSSTGCSRTHPGCATGSNSWAWPSSRPSRCPTTASSARARRAPRSPARRARDRDAGRARARRRRLEGGAAVEGALRRRRVREHGAAPGRPSGGRAAAHQRDGDP